MEEIYDIFLLNKEVSDGSKTIRAKLLNKVHERESRAYAGGRSIIGVRKETKIHHKKECKVLGTETL